MNWTLVIALLLLTGANAENIDYFLDQVQRNIDYNVDPCDNFFRHACPKSMNDAENIVNFEMKTINSWIQHQKEKNPLPETEIEKLYNLATLGKSKYFHAPKSNMIDFLKRLRNVYYFIGYLRENDVHISKDYIRFREIAANILNVTSESMKMSSTELGQNYTNKIVEQLDAHQILFGVEMERNSYSEFIEIQKNIDIIYKQHFMVQRMRPISENDIAENSEQFFDIVESLFETIFLAITSLNGRKSNAVFGLYAYNARNEMPNNILQFFEGILIPARSAGLSAAYGYIGSIIGHELMHSYLNFDRVLKHQLLTEKGICIMRHAQEMCDHYGEGQCNSGVPSYQEDAADFEGVKLAYKAFIEEIGDKLKDSVAPGGNVTNQQMFFYAQAKSHCRQQHVQTRGDNHSTAPIRVNGAVSLINGFHEAFQCKTGDRMRDLVMSGGHCNHFGIIVRR